MSLQEQSLPINFAQGLETKTDPKQLSPGKFVRLVNSVFDVGNLLKKRNGYAGFIPPLPDATSSYLTTFNGNLIAIGNDLKALSDGSSQWVDKGSVQPVDLTTMTLIRNNSNQIQCDTSISSNNLICTVYTDSTTAGIKYKYAVADAITGQNIVPPAEIVPTSGTVSGSPRVFLLTGYFVIVYTTSTNHLQYIRINSANPTSTIEAAVDITTAYTPATTVAFDGVVSNNTLYLAWNGNGGGGDIRMTSYNSAFVRSTSISGTVVDTGKTATVVSVTADNTQSTPVIWVSYNATAGSTGYVLAVNPSLASVLASTLIFTASGAETILNITASAQNMALTVFYELSNNYSYDAAIPTHYIQSNSVTQAGVVSSPSIIKRSLGLASKSFIVDGVIYLMGVYQSPYQPTFFVCDYLGNIILKLAYSNGRGYLVLGLPSVNVSGSVASVSYLNKDLITPVNKNTNVPSGSQVAGVYSQTGINLANLDINTTGLISAEIGNNLHTSGGFLWMYDGYLPVESGFFLWPDSVEVVGSGAGGTIAAGTYYYVATYEWTDNQGNAFRSAPSIPVSVTTVGATSSVTVNVPTLRLTYKTSNPVKIVIYRWSLAQQSYYQVTSITSPVVNSLTTDSIAFVDTLPDSSILGNNLLYTTGGIVENIGPPAVTSMALFKSRLFLIDGEDQNLLWYSKVVIESTPVEMSDLFTLYVAPTTAAQGNTGPMRCLSALDDKLIIFKDNAIYYLVGDGPDNTGANNDFSEPIFITATVGCANQNSIVFMPQGLMFQSDKGIWLLGRDLSTTYIGAPVERYNSSIVQSALNIPGTNQVRFTLDTGETLMYDYYYGQWGTFEGVAAVSSTLYQNLHTFINSRGNAYQETPGSYLDGSNPVNMSFTTGWLNLAGLQGFQRAYSFYLLGIYLSPHKLDCRIAYDYNPSATQSSIITPDNYSPNYGDESLYGGGNYGGNSNVEQWRVYFERQKCEAFQLSISEIFDASIGAPAGAGLTLSGIDLVVGVKSGKPRLKTTAAVG